MSTSKWQCMKIMDVIQSVYEHRVSIRCEKDLWSLTCNEVADLLTILPSTIWEPCIDTALCNTVSRGIYLHPLTFTGVTDFRLYTRNNDPYQHPYAVMVLGDLKDLYDRTTRRLLIIFKSGMVMVPANENQSFGRLPADNRYILWRSMHNHKLGVILEDNLPRPMH